MRFINLKNDEFIEIDNRHIITIDDFVVFDFQGFVWTEHYWKCKTCKLFIDSFYKNLNDWILEYDNNFYRLENNSFSSIKQHANNYFGSVYRYPKNFTEVKLKINHFNISKEEEEKYSNLEEYELCSFINKNIK